MRSVIKLANPAGIAAVVAQQFDVAKQMLAKGLVPIIEPEVSSRARSATPPTASCWPRS